MMDALLPRRRLPGIRQRDKDWLERAAREASQLNRRPRQAMAPFIRTIEPCDFTVRPERNRPVLRRYLDPPFIRSAPTLVFIGAPGLGKTPLAVAICVTMLQLGATVRFVSAQRLATGVLRCRDVAARQRLRKPRLAAALFVLAALGYLPTAPRLGPVLYELIASRYEHNPTIITTNKSLSAWGGLFQAPSRAAAVLDRLRHHGDSSHFKGPAYRLKGKTPLEPTPTHRSDIAGSDRNPPPDKEEKALAL